MPRSGTDNTCCGEQTKKGRIRLFCEDAGTMLRATEIRAVIVLLVAVCARCDELGTFF